MFFNKYSLDDKEFILYGEEFEPDPEETFGIKLVEANIALKDNVDLPIYSFNDLFTKVILRMKTDDDRLEEKKIISFRDLSAEYKAIKLHQSKFSRSLRDLVIKKYIELNNNY